MNFVWPALLGIFRTVSHAPWCLLLPLAPWITRWRVPERHTIPLNDDYALVRSAYLTWVCEELHSRHGVTP